MNLEHQDLNHFTPFKPLNRLIIKLGTVFKVSRDNLYGFLEKKKQFAIIEMNYLFIYQIYFNECTTLTNRRILHLLEQDFYLQHKQYDKGSSK